MDLKNTLINTSKDIHKILIDLSPDDRESVGRKNEIS